MGSHFLLQGFFSTQGSKPGLPLCRQILYHLSHQGSLPSFNYPVALGAKKQQDKQWAVQRQCSAGLSGVDSLAAGDESQVHGSDSRRCPSSERGREVTNAACIPAAGKEVLSVGCRQGPCARLQWGTQQALSCSSGVTVHNPEERLRGVLPERNPVVLPNIPHTSFTTEALFPKAVAIISWGQSLNRNLGKQTLWIISVVSQPEWMRLQGRGHGLFRASTRQRRQEMHMNPNEHE